MLYVSCPFISPSLSYVRKLHNNASASAMNACSKLAVCLYISFITHRIYNQYLYNLVLYLMLPNLRFEEDDEHAVE
jgi:hypothetical protein